MTPPFQSSVAALFAQMAQAGIDLHDATIRVRSATVQSLNRGDTADTIEGLVGSQLRITYEVQTTALGKTGRSLSGDYTLMTDTIERRDDHWRLNGFTLQWERLPEGVLDPAALAAQEFENHVARYRTLPPGILAPDITVTQLDGESPLTLASLRGKVVILDFWATWCGPCQPSMAELQNLLVDHPTWAGRVVVVSVSIDDDIPTLRKHLEARGWNQTLNTWAGPGGWQSAAAKTFRVSSVPTSYLIAPDGKITGAMRLPDPSLTRRVDALLAAPAAKPQTPPAAPSR